MCCNIEREIINLCEWIVNICIVGGSWPMPKSSGRGKIKSLSYLGRLPSQVPRVKKYVSPRTIEREKK
jgi:hypothetical protein